MSKFIIYPLQNSTALYLYGEQDEILLDPPYQRMSGIWSDETRQLLIDSLLNGFDLPKIYFHEPLKTIQEKGRTIRYAIVDGKQRLESIWGFIDGAFTLSDGFEYISDTSVKAAGMSYLDLATMYPKIKSRFDSTSLAVVVIQTDDIELIEEMFSRLNDAVPLNAPEKRNAFGGPLPKVIRRLAREPLFSVKLPSGNIRYRHYDLATKFLYIEHKGKFSDTKKVYLDKFVKDFKNRRVKTANTLGRSVRRVLREMTRVFTNSDPLLSSVGMTVLYYLLFRDATKDQWVGDVTRKTLASFNEERAKNREIAAKDITAAAYELLEFDRLSQSPNDEVAINYRYDVLRQRVGPKRRRKSR